MSISEAKINDMFLDKFLNITAMLREDKFLKIDSGMSVEEEENFRDNYYRRFSQLNPAEVIDLARRVVAKSRKIFQNHPDRAFRVQSLVYEAIGSRLSKKFVDLYPNLGSSKSDDLIEFSPEQEEELKKLLHGVMKDLKKHQYYRVITLYEQLTGKINLE